MRARVHFDEDLETLTAELYNLGDMVIQAIRESFQALSRRDMQRAQRVIEHDRERSIRSSATSRRTH